MTNNIEKLKVLHIVSSLQIGGAERFVLDLCQIQQSKGMKASIMSFGSNSDPLKLVCDDLDILVFTVEGNRLQKWLKIYNIVKGFDVIHFHSPYPLKLMSILLPLFKQKRVVYTRHGADPLSGRSWKALHRLVQKYIDDITFVSQEGADIFENNHGWLDKPKRVIDNGVNLSSVRADRAASKLLRLGSVGRMVDLKNQISLLQAVAMLPLDEQKTLEINFYGDGPCMAELKLFNDRNLENVAVNFHGMVQDRNVIYSSFDALIVTSETEGLSLAIIEAMAYGCVVIASNVGGNPKLVEHNTNGWLFDYNDTDSLAKYLQTLNKDRSLISSFGTEGRKKIELQFSLDNTAQKYTDIYSNTLI